VVEQLGSEDLPKVVDVLCEAFFDYPVMRFVLSESHAYPADLRRLVTFFADTRLHRGEVVLGIRGDDGLLAAGLVSYLDARVSPPIVGEHRERLWARLGPVARARYEAFGAVASTFEVSAPHLHLNMIGVSASARGRGLGRTLLEAVHDLSAADDRSEGVTLTTEDPANVALYEYFGYEIVGRRYVGGAFTTWGFFRPDG
jgi:ribosomal protein S18 acetylase RimI-like enzyme